MRRWTLPISIVLLITCSLPSCAKEPVRPTKREPTEEEVRQKAQELMNKSMQEYMVKDPFGYGCMLMQQRQYPEALKQFNLAIEKASKDPKDEKLREVYFMRAYLYQKMNRLTDAIADLNKYPLLSVNPIARGLLAELYLDTGAYQKAAELNAALQSEAGEEAKTEFLAKQAVCYEKLGNKELSEKTWLAAGPGIEKRTDIKFSGDGQLTAWKAALVEYRRAVGLALAKQYPAAIDKYKQAVYLYPHDFHFQEQLGCAYQYLNDLPSAEKSFRAAVALAPANWLPWHNLAFVLYEQKRLPECKEAARKALQCHPPDDRRGGLEQVVEMK